MNCRVYFAFLRLCKRSLPENYLFLMLSLSAISTKVLYCNDLNLYSVLFGSFLSCSVLFSPSATFIERFIRSCSNKVLLLNEKHLANSTVELDWESTKPISMYVVNSLSSGGYGTRLKSYTT